MSLFKAASTVSALTLVSRITGLARELLIAATFGASALTDAFNIAFRIPNLFRRLFAEGAFSQAFVPVLAASRTQHGDEVTRGLIDQVASLLAAALLALSVLGVAAAPVLVWMLGSGLKQDAQAFDLAVFMTRWMFPYIAFMSMVALGASILNTWKRFAVPAATPVLLNVAMIAAAALLAPALRRWGVEPILALVAGVLAGGVLQLALQAWGLARLGLLPRLALSPQALRAAWQAPGSRRIVQLMLPALLGVSVAQLSLIINTQIASHLTPGSVSWLSYADRLMEFPTALLGVALGVVLMPQLSAARAAGDNAQYSAMLDWGLRLVLLLGLPSAVALLVFAQPMVASLYHYGAFSDRDVQQTAAALVGYGVGLLGLVGVKVLAPGYYASQDIRTPVRIAIVVLVFTQLLNIALVPLLQHAGLALAIGIGALINAGWLLLGLLRRGSYRPRTGWGLFALQVLAATVLMSLWLVWLGGHVSWVGLKAQPLARLGWLALALGGAAFIYFAALWATGLKLREFVRK